MLRELQLQVLPVQEGDTRRDSRHLLTVTEAVGAGAEVVAAAGRGYNARQPAHPHTPPPDVVRPLEVEGAGCGASARPTPSPQGCYTGHCHCTWGAQGLSTENPNKVVPWHKLNKI